MAEERIDIIFYNKKGLGEQLKPMTRQEAIERMAKAICLERNACISKGEMCGLCVLWRNFSTHAEKALNVLLEGKK